MKLSTFFIFAYLFFDLSLICSGQGVETQTNLSQLGATNDPTQVVRMFDDRYKGIKGSPFYWENYVSGKIKFKEGKSYSVKSMNLNSLEDEVVVKTETDSKLIVLNKKNVVSFDVDSLRCLDSYCHFVKIDSEGVPVGYYALLVDKRIKVFCKLSKTILKADFKGAYSASQNYDTFVEEERFYFQNKQGLLTEFKRNQSSIAKLLPEKSKIIQEHIKANRLNPKYNDGLKAIFDFIDTL
jgi:hypothetical protein